MGVARGERLTAAGDGAVNTRPRGKRPAWSRACSGSPHAHALNSSSSVAIVRAVYYQRFADRDKHPTACGTYSGKDATTRLSIQAQGPDVRSRILVQVLSNAKGVVRPARIQMRTKVPKDLADSGCIAVCACEDMYRGGRGVGRPFEPGRKACQGSGLWELSMVR